MATEVDPDADCASNVWRNSKFDCSPGSPYSREHDSCIIAVSPAALQAPPRNSGHAMTAYCDGTHSRLHTAHSRHLSRLLAIWPERQAAPLHSPAGRGAIFHHPAADMSNCAQPLVLLTAALSAVRVPSLLGSAPAAVKRR